MRPSSTGWTLAPNPQRLELLASITASISLPRTVVFQPLIKLHYFLGWGGFGCIESAQKLFGCFLNGLAIFVAFQLCSDHAPLLHGHPSVTLFSIKSLLSLASAGCVLINKPPAFHTGLISKTLPFSKWLGDEERDEGSRAQLFPAQPQLLLLQWALLVFHLRMDLQPSLLSSPFCYRKFYQILTEHLLKIKIKGRSYESYFEFDSAVGLLNDYLSTGTFRTC